MKTKWTPQAIYGLGLIIGMQLKIAKDYLPEQVENEIMSVLESVDYDEEAEEFMNKIRELILEGDLETADHEIFHLIMNLKGECSEE